MILERELDVLKAVLDIFDDLAKVPSMDVG